MKEETTHTRRRQFGPTSAVCRGESWWVWRMLGGILASAASVLMKPPLPGLEAPLSQPVPPTTTGAFWAPMQQRSPLSFSSQAAAGLSFGQNASSKGPEGGSFARRGSCCSHAHSGLVHFQSYEQRLAHCSLRDAGLHDRETSSHCLVKILNSSSSELVRAMHFHHHRLSRLCKSVRRGQDSKFSTGPFGKVDCGSSRR